MSVMRQMAGRYWRPLLYFAWLWELMGLLGNGRHTLFLRPEFGALLGLAMPALLALLLSSLLDAREEPLDAAHALRAAILLLPLAYFWNARGATLDAYAFDKRSVGLPHLERASAADTPPPPDAEDGADALPGPPAPFARGPEEGGASFGAARPATILDLHYAPRAFEGRRVRVLGMLLREDAQALRDFAPGARVLFRFAITCCAADATPLAVVIEGGKLSAIPENAWVEAEGNFVIRTAGGRRTPVLEACAARVAPAPRDPYLH